MKTQKHIGIDLGGESGRVMLGDFDGSQIRLTEKHRFTTGGVAIAETLRWDVLHFWREIQNGLSAVAADGNEGICSVGVDTWGVDYILLDKNDELLGLPWHYRDKRNVGMLEKVTREISRSELFQQTGIQFIEINTLYQLAAATERSPGFLDHAKRLLMIPDFFHWCLSGRAVTEFTNATTTQCFNPTTNDWAWSLFERLRIPSQMFTEIVGPGTSIGTLRNSVSRITGLPSIDVVAPATHDTGSAVAAVPVSKEDGKNWAYVSSGTWSLVGIETSAPILSDEAMQRNVTNEGGVDGTWRLLKNVMGLWLVQRLKIAFDKASNEMTYTELTRRALGARPFTALIDPEHPSFLNPPNMFDALRDFCRVTGQAEPVDAGQATRCVLESLALKYVDVLTSLEKLSGKKVDVLHIVGGGSQNRLLNQFVANACQIPVIAGPVEATVLGNVLVQCRSAGELSSLSDIREVVRRSSDLTRYEPEHSESWSAAVQRFQQLTEQHVTI
ncbi:rhamnulokinase [Rhodopirellula sp. MGV]|uniref:rhamnulokinase n=1 Tax=Rhodopirellula sp. MGV TaxID=2023130 RepID=UPI000B9780A4|nr:rhamnulokinase family protein [Rhodopirellula sp. MGV]OYP37224.1 rhamnulokinase [Rhodopirellula sp. MGV]PNY34142.1 rhamnulokinase [Rhodopirellula baltica]